jgi:hydroxypyruvate isomerase
MLGLNTHRGNVAAGDNGLSAVPGREDEARAAIDQAIEYAAEIACNSAHVMAGFANGPEAHACFLGNLRYATERARGHGITVLIEPLNSYDAPGYFLQTTVQAVGIIEEIVSENLKLMFDCYHVQLMEGDLSNRLAKLLPLIGHIQFASVPGRGAPGQGEIAYDHIFAHIASLGYDRALGAEYKPNGPTEATLGWLPRR